MQKNMIFGALPSPGKSANFQVPENGTLSARIQKLRPLFHANIPPKWWPGEESAPKIMFFCIFDLLSYRYKLYQVGLEFRQLFDILVHPTLYTVLDTCLCF